MDSFRSNFSIARMKRSNWNNRHLAVLKHFLFFSTLLFISCSDEIESEIASIEVDVNINRLDQKLFECENETEILKLIGNNRDQFNLYLELNKLPNDSALSHLLFQRISDPHVDSFFVQCKEEFGDFSKYKREIEQLFRHVKYYYPDFEAPEINTFFTAFLSPADIIVGEKHILIGLEYFIGPESMYVQNDPQYILDRYTPQNLVPMFIGLGISNFYNESADDDPSLIADMVFYGKAHYFLSKMVPGISDESNLGFTLVELEYFSKNEKVLWSYFVDQALLFETNRIETSKYISERPKVLEIDPECPGRVGRWIGYQIVKSYMKKNEQTLQDLMSTKDAQKLFRNSGYNPSR